MPLHDGSISTSPSLIQRARAFDADAWHRLCEVYGPVVYGWARAKGLQDTDAADLGQEVFRTVAARIPDFHRDRPGDTFRGWLWTITYHKLGDFFRAELARPQADGGSTAQWRFHEMPAPSLTDSAEDLPDDAEGEILDGVLALIRLEFTEKTWNAFWRATVEGQSAAQIASELGLSPQAVRQAKYKVIKRLREEMQDEVAP